MTEKKFEELLKDLEHIVKELETGELPLEAALKRFEDGMALSKRCSQILDQTEQKVSQLIQDSEGLVTEQVLAAKTPEADD
jgi:exodeoxyribonuclease VII small subunit